MHAGQQGYISSTNRCPIINLVNITTLQQETHQEMRDPSSPSSPSSPKPPMQSTDGMSRHRLTPYKPTIIHDNC